jgi:hypothetical protein
MVLDYTGANMNTKKLIATAFLVTFLPGCGAFSATTLRCGVDGESSWVEVASAPQSLSANTRALAELCGFAYDQDQD